MSDKLKTELEKARDVFLGVHDLSSAHVVTRALAGDKEALYDWRHYVKHTYQRYVKESKE